MEPTEYQLWYQRGRSDYRVLGVHRRDVPVAFKKVYCEGFDASRRAPQSETITGRVMWP